MIGRRRRRLRILGLLALADVLAFVLVGLCGCVSPRPAATAPVTYHGISPCPDCAGVATALTLHPSGGYLLESRRLGTGEGARLERGVVKRRGGGKTVLYPEIGELPYYLTLTDTSARWLAVWQRSVADDTSGAYVLAPGAPVRLGPGERELFVDANREACRGPEGELDSCLRVLRPSGSGGATWEPLSREVAGFAHEPGWLYHLVVRDAESSLALVREVSRAPDVRLPAYDTYALIALGGEAFEGGGEAVTFELDVNGRRVRGTDGCTRYQARLEALGVDGLRIGPLAGSRGACDARARARAQRFRSAMAAVRAYRRLPGGRLRLLGADGTELALLGSQP